MMPMYYKIYMIITKIEKFKKLKKYKYYLSGYLITMIIHGLLYEDRFDFKIYR